MTKSVWMHVTDPTVFPRLLTRAFAIISTLSINEVQNIFLIMLFKQKARKL